MFHILYICIRIWYVCMYAMQAHSKPVIAGFTKGSTIETTWLDLSLILFRYAVRVLMSYTQFSLMKLSNMSSQGTVNAINSYYS